MLITGLVWRQDHNGFTHQDPGFIDVVANKSPDVVRIYLPPDANCLLSVADHCLRSVNYVNVIVADKKQHLQYLDMDAAIAHCTKGAGIWDWASNDQGAEPDVVMAGVRRRAHDRGPGGYRVASPAPARREGPVRERGGPVQARARTTSTRTG